VTLGKALTLATVADVKVALSAALAGDGPVEIDARDLDDIDVAGLQLLCAAHRGASRQKRALTVTGAGAPGAPGGLAARLPVVARAISDLGFGRDAGCVDGCLCKEATRG
jgi:hypothetical protein